MEEDQSKEDTPKMANRVRLSLRYATEGRGERHGILTIRREERTAEPPLVGPHHELDPRSVRQVCEALGLALSDLPEPKGRV